MITNNYITSRLQGRTGNMMFQLAHGYTKSLEYNRQFIAPSRDSSSQHLEKTLFRKLDFRIGCSYEHGRIIWSEFEYNELKPYDGCPTCFAGWYQSEKFFSKYTEVIKDLYSPTKEFEERAYNSFPFLKDSKVLVINVRRGDYLTQPTRHPVITLEYIYEAIKHIPDYDIILVISDDIQWCKDNIRLPNCVFNNDDYYDCDALWLMSMCSHFVISNSSFSWWGAYLSRNPDKIVVAPDTWFGADVPDNPKDIWCDDWIRISTYCDNGFLKLKQ